MTKPILNVVIAESHRGQLVRTNRGDCPGECVFGYVLYMGGRRFDVPREQVAGVSRHIVAGK